MSKPISTPLKKPIGALAVLNLADGILTYWGLLAGAIEEQSAEAAHLIEDLLVAARADLNGLQLHLESFPLGEQAEAVTMSIPAAYDRQIPIEDDGSFHIEVPSGIPLRFAVLNGEGGTLAEQHSWTWVMPREWRGCIGCHEDREMVVPNVMADAFVKPVVRLVPSEGSHQ